MCGSQDSSMIGQGSYLKALSPPAAPSAELCDTDHQVLGTPFTTSSCTPTPPPALPFPTPGELRRLAKAPHPTHLLKCPRCDSLDTKFCYYNNYSLSQPRYFCKNCKRYWTAGGALRNVAVGGGLRKNKRCKLKLQAEAEAAAAAVAAARDLATQEASDQPHLATIGSSSTSCTSSTTIVSGIPANFAMTAAPSMIRTTSGSDESTIEYAGSDICGSTGAAAAHVMITDPRHQTGNHQLQHFFGELCAAAQVAAVPQFYSSYSTSLAPSILQQYGGAITSESGAAPASYHAVGYANQLVQSNSSTGMNLYSRDKGAAAVGSNPAHNYSNGGAAYHVGSEAGGDVCSNELKEEEEEETINANPQYDWQLISENLFNGAAAEGFCPLSGGSWPDFSQFQDPSGPG